MPDWTYQTVFRPALRRLGFSRGRRLALGCMGRLSRLPLGRHVIQWMGHMKPEPELAFQRGGLDLAGPVGLGCGFDPRMLATPAFAEFGFGFLEIGPVTEAAVEGPGRWQVDESSESITADRAAATFCLADAVERMRRDGPLRLPLFARIEPESPEQSKRMCAALSGRVSGFVVPADRLEHVEAVVRDGSPESGTTRWFVCLSPAQGRDASRREVVSQAIRKGRFDGVVVARSEEGDGVRRLGKPEFTEALETVRRVRRAVGPEPLILGAVGIHTPADALDYLEAGANLVQVDSGLAFAGPGLPKRINEALLYRRLSCAKTSRAEPLRWGAASWFWALLMGLSMLIGGVLAMAVATTRVVLPYDEMLAGLTRDQLVQINDRLLSFMTHDRVTLAGTMLAVGILYVTLAWYGIRRGVHWAYVAVAASALSGFASFFSFLGFGYFDPFHAFVTAVLFQFLLLTIHARLPSRRDMEPPDLWNDWRWRASQWGQLLFVVHGTVLIVAGVVISIVGMTSVFVPEDLEFMRTSAEELYGAHPRLVPLVAHDRATFGGMLLACGVATLLPALWGFRRGQWWLWSSLLAAGTIAYAATLLVHWTVGYHSLKHLVPAYGGLALLWVGSLASYGFLAARDERLDAEWKRRLKRAVEQDLEQAEDAAT